MKEKKIFYTELAYVVGIIALAFGTSLMEKAEFGMSMVVAPAYLVYLKVSDTLSWFTFGMAEYCLQALLIVILSLALRRFKIKFLFSFCTAVVYGFVLDFFMWLVKGIPSEGWIMRCVLFVLGLLLCSAGVAFLFHTYIAPEAYELVVKEISDTYNKKISRVKTVYDCTSCLIAVVLSFVFFGLWHFEGVKLGTVFCALVNGWIIGRISVFLENRLEFKDGLKNRGKHTA